MSAAEKLPCECGHPVRDLPDPIPPGTDLALSEALCDRALYCAACLSALGGVWSA